MLTSNASVRSGAVAGVWRLEAGQHHQSRAENTFYRYKKRFGGRLSARNEEAQRNEVLTACNILNRMTELGMPNSIELRG